LTKQDIFGNLKEVCLWADTFTKELTWNFNKNKERLIAITIAQPLFYFLIFLDSGLWSE
jgi:hypothetical protein